MTQQLAKLVYYPNEDRVARKVPVMAVALKIELRFDKAEIMADYWSVVPTGYGLVGAREAACALFGHDRATLSVSEAAQLAGSVQAPSISDARYRPDRAKARRDFVLGRMVEVGYLDAREAAAARREPVLADAAGRSPSCR